MMMKNNNKETSTAAYNFVELNQMVATPPLAEACQKALQESDHRDVTQALQKGYKAYMTKDRGKKHSGYIEVTIRNKTPLFVGSGDNGFFCNGSSICLPGSSLRGCLRRVFQVITNSAMHIGNRLEDRRDNLDMNNRRFFFRNIARKGNKNNRYTERIKKSYAGYLMDVNNPHVEADESSETKKRAGFLVRKTASHDDAYSGYFIYEANCECKSHPMEIENKKACKCQWNLPDAQVEVHVGKMYSPSGMRKYYIFTIPDDFQNTKHYEVPADVIKIYRDDRGRGSNGLSLLEPLDAHQKCTLVENGPFPEGKYPFNFMVPCFFELDDGKVKSFGANPFYRLPYEHIISDHVPASIRGHEDIIDFTDAVFGKTACWSSRIAVEDCYLQSGEESFESSRKTPLLGPKPTSYQLYLNGVRGRSRDWDEVSPENTIRGDKTEVSIKSEDVNPENTIRGDKMYWHRRCDWKQIGNPAADENRNSSINDEVMHTITPLKKDHCFCGKIRFEQLDDVELGALLSLFHIDELARLSGSSYGEKMDLCYKIGMGKPLGLGSIKMEGKLYLRDEDAYCRQLFDGQGHGFAAALSSGQAQTFVEAFYQYMKQQLQDTNCMDNYRNRLKDLCALMDWSWTAYPEWNSKIQDMGIEAGKKKGALLPTAQEIVEKLRKGE